MALVLIEILFFAHSTIVFGVLGIFLMVASLLWAMIDRYPGETFFPTGQMLAVPLLKLFFAIIAAGIVIAILARICRARGCIEGLLSSPQILRVHLSSGRRVILPLYSHSPPGRGEPPSPSCDRAGKRALPIGSLML